MGYDSDDSSSGSDYFVDDYVKPDRISALPVNDESADLLGNFDDAKRLDIENGVLLTEPEERNKNIAEESSGEEVNDFSEDEMKTEENAEDNNEEETSSNKTNMKLSKNQLENLMRGASKTSRFVLYVTNLNFETTKPDLTAHFSQAGDVKGVRIPPKRRGGFAFVEMNDAEGFQKAFELHNSELQGRSIKVQISEGGKKKSANKKNILKQKNRKLAEIRNENKSFTKSGKNYNKSIKKEIAKEMLLKKRWRKPKKPVPK